MEVSVFCITYNHENYIRKALEGFVSQKTNFSFEVLIHDDASTDNTASIIREYEEKYPEIIKAVYQTENQYSKGNKIIKSFLLPKAKGKYYAICEGDDYWIDPYKLQKQYDFLSKNPEYSFCVHCANYHFINENRIEKIPNISCDRDYTLDDIIRSGGGIFATNSLFIRKEAYAMRPEVFDTKGFGDYQMFMYGAISGKCRCLHDIMSVYAAGVSGSWTDRIWNNTAKRIEHYKVLIDMLKRVDKYYNGQFSDSINYKINETEFQILILEEKYNLAKKEPYKQFWKSRRKSKMLSFLKKHFPFLITIKKYIKK